MSEVLEEHLDYLGLTGRAARFAEAFLKTINPSDIVADLGCGVGVLGLLALSAGARRVWGLDQSDAIELARETIKRQGLAEQYLCLRGSTFTTELPERVDLLVCDHVGYFGLDYGIVAMVADARRRFLKPGGRVIPRQIILRLAAASGPGDKLVEAWARQSVPGELHWIRERAANAKHRHTFVEDELCSPPAELGAVALDQDTPDLLRYGAQLAITRDCTLDGLAGWFDCELAPGVWMTNSPLVADRIERPNAFLPCREPFDVRAGDVIDVSVKITHEPFTISWTIRDPASGKNHRHSTWSNIVLDPADLAGRDLKPVSLSPKGAARKAILKAADGSRTLEEIEDAILRAHPGLFPTEAAIRRFVRREIRDGFKW